MTKWLSGAAYVLALSGLTAPATADAQRWLDRALAAKRKADSVRAALRGTPQGGDSAEAPSADAGTSAADGEVARTPSAGGRRRPGCMAYNTYQCAASAVLGESLDGAINGNGGQLFYRFTVDQPGVYRFDLDPVPNRFGVSMQVTDARYQELGALQWGAGQPGTQLLQIANPGTYYAHLSTGVGGVTAVEAIAFTVARNSRSRPSPAPTPEPSEDAACSQNNTFQCAEDAQVGERIMGAIGGNAKQLYYRLEVSQPGTMEFRLNPMPNRSGVQLTVTDDRYQRLGVMTYPKGQPKGQLLRLAAPGTYFVLLKGGAWSSEAERFALTVSRQP